ncbi:hypothetical protein ACGFT2_14190 [Streptomyces sp. NPDC048514]|uniref:hypothetical protein n=1 Tax=Streptomyces sp. NPDC048514 TaxID=3365564 RepID=UPI0037107C47
MRVRRPVPALATAAVLAALVTGCADQDGVSAPPASGASTAPSGTPSGYADMKKKVDAAESAAAAADRDATDAADR